MERSSQQELSQRDMLHVNQTYGSC